MGPARVAKEECQLDLVFNKLWPFVSFAVNIQWVAGEHITRGSATKGRTTGKVTRKSRVMIANRRFLPLLDKVDNDLASYGNA